MNLSSITVGFLVGFTAIFPLVTSSTRPESNQNVLWALLGSAAVSAVFLYLRVRSEPLRWPPVARIVTVLGVAILGYALALLGVTYGIDRLEFIFFIPITFGVMTVLLRIEYLEILISRQIRLALIGLILVATVACLLTTHQQIALLGSYFRKTGLLSLWGCAIMFLLVVTFARTATVSRRIVVTMLCGGAFIAALSLWQFFDFGGSAQRWFYDLHADPRPMGTLGHPNWFGTYLCLLLPLAAALYLEARTFSSRITSAMSCLLIFAALLVCQTRGAWVATGCFLTWLAIRHRFAWAKLLPLFAAMAVVAGVLIPSKDWKIYHRMLTFENEVERAGEGSPGTGSSRFGYWMYGLRHLPPRLLLGAGLDTYEEIGLRDATPPHIDKAHSIYLEYAVTLGIPGLALYLIFLWACVRPLPDTRESLLRWGLKASIVTYFIQGIFIHDTIHTWPLVWVIAGLAAAREISPNPKAN